jgi:hypothetical protein
MTTTLDVLIRLSIDYALRHVAAIIFASTLDIDNTRPPTQP